MTRAKAFALASQSVALRKTGGGGYQVTRPMDPLRPDGKQGRQTFKANELEYAKAYRARTVATHALALLGVPYSAAEVVVFDTSMDTAPRFEARELLTVALARLRVEDTRRRAQ